jgi:hypothetical protein
MENSETQRREPHAHGGNEPASKEQLFTDPTRQGHEQNRTIAEAVRHRSKIRVKRARPSPPAQNARRADGGERHKTAQGDAHDCGEGSMDR